MSVKDKLQSGAQGVRAESIAAAGLHFLAGFLLSAGQLAGGAAPFGTAAVAAAPVGLRGASALAGACLGYLTTGSLDWGIYASSRACSARRRVRTSRPSTRILP